MAEEHPPSRNSRWTCLASVAALNLVIWMLVALAAGLLASQRINLGFEAFFREGPSTVIAYVKQVVLTPSSQRGPAATATIQSMPPDGPRTAIPVVAPTEPGGAAPQPGIGTSPSPDPLQTLDVPQAAASPVAYLLSWSDPPLERVLQMDAEMAKSALGRDVQIRYSESALNDQVAAFLERFPHLPYEHVTLDLQPDRVVVRGRVTVLGIAVDVEVAGLVSIRDCRLWAEIDSISILDLPTPGVIEREIALMLQEALAWHPEDHPLCLEALWIDDHWVSLDGYRR